MNKLKINIEKLKTKLKLFKSNRFKALLGASLVAATLSSCNTNIDTNESKSNSNSYVQTIEENEKSFIFNMNLNNSTKEIKNTESITVLSKDGEILNILNNNDDVIKTTLSTKASKLYSAYLNEYINIPEINDGEKFVVNIDYATKDISTEVENTNIKLK